VFPYPLFLDFAVSVSMSCLTPVSVSLLHRTHELNFSNMIYKIVNFCQRPQYASSYAYFFKVNNDLHICKCQTHMDTCVISVCVRHANFWVGEVSYMS